LELCTSDLANGVFWYISVSIGEFEAEAQGVNPRMEVVSSDCARFVPVGARVASGGPFCKSGPTGSVSKLITALQYQIGNVSKLICGDEG